MRKTRTIEVEQDFESDNTLFCEVLKFQNFIIYYYPAEDSLYVTFFAEKEDCEYGFTVYKDGRFSASRMDKLPEIFLEGLNIEQVDKALDVVAAVKLLKNL